MDAVSSNDDKAFASKVFDLAVTLMVGVFFAACGWLWMANGESLMVATILSGLPTCF